MLLRPGPLLQPFVEALWATPRGRAVAPREHSLPTGAMHIALRLDGAALRLYASADDTVGDTVSCAVVGGARSTYCIKDTATPTRSVGAVLRPGAARALFGCGAQELAGRHVALELLWGRDAARLLERVPELDDPAAQIALLDAALQSRLRPVRALHPHIAQAMREVAGGVRVSEVVASSGHSHRHFIAQFRDAVGLPPKAWARVVRLQKALRELDRNPSCTDVALAAGFSDQAHFNREFRQFAGMTPRDYRRTGKHAPQHVPVGARE